MYLSQNVRVRFNQSYSEFFQISNGVKQGGVLSPILFSIYIDILIELLHKSGYGCKVGDVYVGCIAYADDILILTASLYSLNQMIKICELYAEEFSVKFNGNKSQLIIFEKKKSNTVPNVLIKGEKVEIVDKINYLGFNITNEYDRISISSLSNDFNIKVNSFLGDFYQITSVLKNKLFPLYCTSFYGSHLCDFRKLNEINVQWRKAIRRIWGLPFRAHNNLLYHISKSLPPDVIFKRRFIKLFFDSLECNNPVVNYMFRSALTQNCRIGANMRLILFELGIPMNSDILYKQGMTKKLCDAVLERWNVGLNESDKRLGEHVLELIERRDSLDTWILNKKEIQDVIDMLCTA